MNESETPPPQWSPLRLLVQAVLVFAVILTGFGMFLSAAIGAPTGMLVVIGIQIAGLIAILIHMRQETRPRIIGLYFLIAAGFYLLTFGICVNTQ